MLPLMILAIGADYEPMRGSFVGGGINDGRTRTNGASDVAGWRPQRAIGLDDRDGAA